VSPDRKRDVKKGKVLVRGEEKEEAVGLGKEPGIRKGKGVI